MGAPVSRANNFDFLRLVAAILVLFSHCYPLIGRPAGEPFVFLSGYETGGGLAVSVFFVISGYLITASYLNSKGTFDFMIKRVMRIFPALIVAVLLSILLGAFLTPLAAADYFTHPQTLAYLNNIWLNVQYHLPLVFAENVYPHAVNGSLWTLPVEFFMYVLILLMGLFGLLKPRFVLAATVVSFAGYVAVHHWLSGMSLVVLGAAQLEIALKLGCFFFSGACFFLFKNSIQFKPLIAILLTMALLVSLGAAWGVYVYLIAMPYLVFYFAGMDTPSLRNASRYGDFSYGIYIYAFPMQQLVIYLFGPDLSVRTFFLLALVPTLILAILSWKLVEAPALGLLRSPLFKRATTFRLRGKAVVDYS